MHHYGTSSALSTLGVRPAVQGIWRDYIPQQSVKHPFLMHGILALSALHIAYENDYQTPQYLRLCDKHQTIALKEFRKILSSPVDDELLDALFVLSATISCSSMARACAASAVEDEPGGMTMEYVTEYFFLTRGVRDVIQMKYDHFENSPLSMMFDAYVMPEGTVITLPQEVRDQFTALRHMVASWGLDPEALTHCQSALSGLEEIYENVYYWASLGEIYTGQVVRWITMVTTGYVRLVQARNQPALVVFAHFAAITSANRTAWYIQNWGQYALRGVSVELEESMLHWMEWPARHLEDRMSILGVTLTQDEATPKKPMFGFGQD